MRGLKKALQKTVKLKNSNNKATEKNQDSDLKNDEPSAKTPQRKKSITKNEKPNLSEIKVYLIYLQCLRIYKNFLIS